MASFSRLMLLAISTTLMAAGQVARPVRLQTVQFTPANQALTYSGTIEARVAADLAFRVGGKIIERPVNLGDKVKAGQVLAQLDPTDLRLSLEAEEQAVVSANADAANARAELRRYAKLGASSPAYLPSEFDKRQSADAMAQARLAQARRQLAQDQNQLVYSTLRADADGAITSLPMQVGQVVQVGQTVATLAHSQEIEAEVAVPENRLPDIRQADEVSVALWSDPTHKLRGRVREIGALADANSRTFTVRISLLDPPPEAGLGMTATVQFARLAGTPSLAHIPASALTDMHGKLAVWVFDPHTAHASLRPIEIAALGSDGSVAVSAGLQSGDQVITAGANEAQADMILTPWSGTQF